MMEWRFSLCSSKMATVNLKLFDSQVVCRHSADLNTCRLESYEHSQLQGVSLLFPLRFLA